MNFTSVINPARIRCKEWEEKVQSGLSYSPADMARLTNENRAIKMQELQVYQYHDGLPSDAPVPRELRRGVDENDLWNEAGSTHDKLVDYNNKKKRSQKANLEEV